MPKINILLLGDPNCGKTTMAESIAGVSLSLETKQAFYPNMIFVAYWFDNQGQLLIGPFKKNERCDACSQLKDEGYQNENHITYNVIIWDFRYNSRDLPTLRCLCRASNSVLLTYDITNKKSFSNLSKWMEELRRYGKNPDKIIVGTKWDAPFQSKDYQNAFIHKREISYDQGMKFAQKHDLWFFETSAKIGINNWEVLEMAINNVINHCEFTF